VLQWVTQPGPLLTVRLQGTEEVSKDSTIARQLQVRVSTEITTSLAATAQREECESPPGGDSCSISDSARID
jgi:hypothetical protein